MAKYKAEAMLCRGKEGVGEKPALGFDEILWPTGRMFE
jgi:hypothetical protein